MASLIKSPISRSELAEIVATCAISSRDEIGLAIASISLTTCWAAARMPRLRSEGFMPAATAFTPSAKMALVRTVAVVVPSPAASFVRVATCRTSCAPMFSNLSLNSMFLATVTPSFVILGAPYGWSRIAFRPFGPKVTLTASASWSTPLNMSALPSVPKLISLPLIWRIPLASGRAPRLSKGCILSFAGGGAAVLCTVTVVTVTLRVDAAGAASARGNVPR